MNANDTGTPPTQQSQPPDRQAALWANFILQQSNMTLMFLGKLPGPEGNEAVVDLEAASMFIDTLEMIEERTRGNVETGEAKILRDTLMNLRMLFVQTAESQPAAGTADPKPDPQAASPEIAAAESAGDAKAAPAAEADESRRRFSKKY